MWFVNGKWQFKAVLIRHLDRYAYVKSLYQYVLSIQVMCCIFNRYILTMFKEILIHLTCELIWFIKKNHCVNVQ